MTLLPSQRELLARQIRLIVSPLTTTISESRAILSELQHKFGPVVAFNNERHDPGLRRALRPSAIATATATAATQKSPSTSDSTHIGKQGQTIIALFESARSKDLALDASLLTISCGGDLVPTAKVLDPYEARGIRGRHHPPKKTFSCRILEEEAGEGGGGGGIERDTILLRRLADENPYNGSFRVDPLQISYGNLFRSGAPLREIADIMHTDKIPSEVDPTRKWYHAGLMASWKKGMGEKGDSGRKQS